MLFANLHCLSESCLFTEQHTFSTVQFSNQIDVENIIIINIRIRFLNIMIIMYLEVAYTVERNFIFGTLMFK